MNSFIVEYYRKSPEAPSCPRIYIQDVDKIMQKKKISDSELEENPSAIFLTTTSGRIQAIRQGLEELGSGARKRAVIEEILQNFHKISGSSGVYGFPELGAVAKESERSLLEIDKNARSLSGEMVEQLSVNSEKMQNMLIEIAEKHGLDITKAAGVDGGGAEEPALEKEYRKDRVSEQARILVVDDDVTILDLVKKHLTRAGYSIKTAANGTLALEEVINFSPDMIILDIMLPDIDGIDLLKIIRRRPGGNILPIMFLTAKDGLEDRIQGLSIGGDDYITKPFYPEELVARVGALVARTTILKELAVKDGLTGIYNHRYFYEKLLEEITRWKRYGRKFTLVLIDLDFFKNVNDTYGHVVGDHVLRQTAIFLQNQLRTVDLVARYGGEEFAIILAETDIKLAYKVLKRIYEKLKEWEIELPDSDRKLQITFSAGLATCPEDGIDEKVLVSHSDEALYAAKEGGRNQFVLYKDLIRILHRIPDYEESQEDEKQAAFGAKGTIFVAEDDHLISNMLKLYLEKEGYQVRVFPNGAELLAIVNLEKPDVILMDVMMPLMDGIKALEIIKSQGDIKNIPVIMLTSLDNKGISGQDRMPGAADYVQKPFDPAVLVKVIQQHILDGMKRRS